MESVLGIRLSQKIEVKRSRSARRQALFAFRDCLFAPAGGSGMRWGADGADAVCHLRALFKSEADQWDAFWRPQAN